MIRSAFPESHCSYPHFWYFNANESTYETVQALHGIYKTLCKVSGLYGIYMLVINQSNFSKFGLYESVIPGLYESVI